MLEGKGWNKGDGGFEDGRKEGGVVNEEKGNERVRSLGREELDAQRQYVVIGSLALLLILFCLFFSRFLV